MLWLALWLPDLPLAAHPARPLPSAVVDRGRLIACDETAAAAGIAPGMRAATARGMLPELALLTRDLAAEAACLDEIACWAGNYTPDIVRLPPAALLLEIGGCLRLFGGQAALLAAVHAGCRQRDLAPQTAIAPTPLAALWLAQSAAPTPASPIVATREALADSLAALPAQVLADSELQAQQLAAFGLRSIGQLLQLPRAALARRLGADCVLRLEQALGERPDPRPRFAFPERFAQHLPLPGRAHEAGALRFAGERLLAALCGWLAVRQQGVVRCTLTLHHEPLPGRPRSTPLTLTLGAPTREPARLARVLRERLERATLPAPVEALTLATDLCEELPGASRALPFAAGGAASDDIEALVEQLRARLGDAAVCGLAAAADHRPENATRRAAVGSPGSLLRTPAGSGVRSAAAPDAARPLLLFTRPQALAEVDGRPQHRRTPLELVGGPERIESGWWDDAEPGAAGDVRREYFVARNPQNEYLWIFRNRDGWHLHGVFA